ncbi:hypothetical protein [Streptomyces sp. VB1]|uniref:hypothetical protein n=1 Tax=Streptomyces sp. VB1 TaxID=2986803 RepID=UPI002241A559|nr:hypothetical protein [Streptomyces sp. VB1]UZI26807.1 hypothetical protein OH133_01020 [Streptomyces sp. VB1]
MSVIRRGVVNRSLLGVAGLVLVVCGGWLAVGDGSAWVPVVDRVPHWWPTPSPDGVLLDRGLTARLREKSWWSPALITGLALVLALLGWWLARQALSGRTRWSVLPRSGPVLRRRAWERAMATQVAAFDEVARARVRLVGGRPLRAVVTVVVEPGARPAQIVRSVAGVIAEARDSGGVRSLSADIRVRVANRRERRTR